MLERSKKPLISGTRKSMFIVDETNGLGDGNVVSVSDWGVEDFCFSVCALNVKSAAKK